jgi:hypothetical protein
MESACRANASPSVTVAGTHPDLQSIDRSNIDPVAAENEQRVARSRNCAEIVDAVFALR